MSAEWSALALIYIENDPSFSATKIFVGAHQRGGGGTDAVHDGDPAVSRHVPSPGVIQRRLVVIRG